MRRWSEVAERVAATTRTSEKTALLAEYLGGLTAAELPIAVVFLTGRPFAEADQRAAGLGWAAIATTVTDLAHVPRSALGEAYDRSSDMGRAVADVLTLADHAPDPTASPSLPEVAAAYAAIEAASGPAAKSGILRDLLARADPLTAKYIVKVLGGELRIGLREGLVEAAIAKAFDRPLDAVKWAGMLTGDIGRMAELARDDRLDEASLALFHPIKFMLASPAEDADDIVKRLGVPVWVEDKYDGIRAQLHRDGDDVRLYSRDLHDISGQFPEVVDGARGLAWNGILDGEILAYRDGTVMPFQSRQARLGRKSPSAAIRSEVPVIYVACDVLGLGNGKGQPVEALLREPLEDRRRRLETHGLPLADDGGAFALSHLVSVTTSEGLEDAFLGARERRNEGLMVKDPRSIYSPGRRGLGWLKMKKALATIDCVVVGVEVGHGKRHGVLSDYTFAVRDTDADRLVTIGKAYSGLTDAEIAEMTAWFEAHTIQRFGRYRQVEPTVVVEVAFDVIVRSTRHQSGYSLRFPRIAALRTDKTADEIDTIQTARAVYEGLQHGAEQLETAGARKQSGPLLGAARRVSCAPARHDDRRKRAGDAGPHALPRRVRHQGPPAD